MESLKKVFVALADKKFIEHSKSLFYSAKVHGKWDGDFVLIVPEEDRDTFNEKEFTDRGIEIFFGKKGSAIEGRAAPIKSCTLSLRS